MVLLSSFLAWSRSFLATFPIGVDALFGVTRFMKAASSLFFPASFHGLSGLGRWKFEDEQYLQDPQRT